MPARSLNLLRLPDQTRRDNSRARLQVCEKYAKSEAPTSTPDGPHITASPTRAGRVCPLGVNGVLCSARGTCDFESQVCVCNADGVDAACGCPIGTNGISCSAHGNCDEHSGACQCLDGFGGPECSLLRDASAVASWYAPVRSASVEASSATQVEAQCSPGCAPHWLGDSACDYVCSVPECANDHADCVSSRPSDAAKAKCPCPLLWIGDGHCDPYCGSAEECLLDGGDCGESAKISAPSLPPGSPEKAALPKPFAPVSTAARCAPLCDPLLVGDGSVCDSGCNTRECGYDAGDCARGCMPGCFDFYRGDGFCDDVCNVALCDFDAGDCASASDRAVQDVEVLTFDGLLAEVTVGGILHAQVSQTYASST